ncbi:class I SAM-dependent methyltransferase [Tardiphaga sp.]|uniref:class I SAM-dependent methyltransferase n=1 Tax=Tardiphaga sp. TaxID=1926292 RepID=UPI0026034F7F|nr:class I SAM-dependent methyltransferase [Tardiphaga sp.]MDB5617774.1 Methyltransferase type 11 [Tardiphaga sp.]
MIQSSQDKAKEIAFFDGHAAADSYDVFTPESSHRLIAVCAGLAKFQPGARIADLGCGSGAFTHILQQQGYDPVGIDISPKLIALAKDKYPTIEFAEGDVEHLPFAADSLDGVLLSGLVHHLPDPARCAAEAFRVLRPGGSFVAFDPNRMNPFMYLYRDRSSPLYSSVGVTENERPVLAREIAATFDDAGFNVRTDFMSNLNYRYLASAKLRWLLPAYNAIDRIAFTPNLMKPLRSFVLTYGEKP